MNVPSPIFLLFAAVAALVFNLGRSVGWRQAVLLGANLVFLASFSRDPVTFLPFAGFIALGYAAYRLAAGRLARGLFVGLLVLVLAVFVWLKRYSFVPSATFLPFPYVLIGLSYVFFRVMHVVIDGHQDAIDGRIGLVSYLNYTLNFTSLVSGPIQFYQPYRGMELERLPLDLPIMGAALERIVVGYFKVAIVSALLSMLQHGAIDDLLAGGTLADRVGAGVLVASVYPVYLYFNFSGYVDVVIGVARFFRIELPENFNRPFAAESFIIFWSRWHMTLSGWLKTYVYNPIMMAGMTRVTSPALGPYVAVFAFFVTFFLVGLWHGQTTEFLFYGFLQGGGIAANKLYQIKMADRLGKKGYRTLAANRLYRVCCRGLTFTWFTLTLFWFWSGWTQIGAFCHALGAGGLALVGLAILVGSALVLEAMEVARALVLSVRWQRVSVVESRYTRTAWGAALVAIVLLAGVVLSAPAPDIVYKAF